MCLNVPVARTGTQDYLPQELGLPHGEGRLIPVYRPEEEVFSPATLASFEGMPVTDDHPADPAGVTTENIHFLQKGHATNIRRGSGDTADLLLADLLITDPRLIDKILQEGKREISCGYTYELCEEEGRYVQRHIRGNHVAVVDAGRAGPRVCIKDQKPKYERSNPKMTHTKIARLLARMARDGSAEEAAELIGELLEPEIAGAAPAAIVPAAAVPAAPAVAAAPAAIAPVAIVPTAATTEAPAPAAVAAAPTAVAPTASAPTAVVAVPAAVTAAAPAPEAPAVPVAPLAVPAATPAEAAAVTPDEGPLTGIITRLDRLIELLTPAATDETAPAAKVPEAPDQAAAPVPESITVNPAEPLTSLLETLEKEVMTGNLENAPDACSTQANATEADAPGIPVIAPTDPADPESPEYAPGSRRAAAASASVPCDEDPDPNSEPDLDPVLSTVIEPEDQTDACSDDPDCRTGCSDRTGSADRTGCSDRVGCPGRSGSPACAGSAASHAAADAASRNAIRQAIALIRPALAAMPKAQQTRIVTELEQRLRASGATDRKPEQPAYTGISGSTYAALKHSHAAASSDVDLGQRIMASRNVNYARH